MKLLRRLFGKGFDPAKGWETCSQCSGLGFRLIPSDSTGSRGSGLRCDCADGVRPTDELVEKVAMLFQTVRPDALGENGDYSETLANAKELTEWILINAARESRFVSG